MWLVRWIIIILLDRYTLHTVFLCHSRLQVRNHNLNSSKVFKRYQSAIFLMTLCLQPDVSTFHMLCCVRLTGNMMRNSQIAVELAMVSTASTVDIEDGPILN